MQDAKPSRILLFRRINQDMAEVKRVDLKHRDQNLGSGARRGPAAR